MSLPRTWVAESPRFTRSFAGMPGKVLGLDIFVNCLNMNPGAILLMIFSTLLSSRTDFQMTRLDSGDCLADQHANVHPLLITQLRGKFASKQRRLHPGRGQFDDRDIAALKLHAQWTA